MTPYRMPVRVVHHFSKEKLEEFRDMPAEAKLRWLENANRLLCQVYLSSGNPAPYDPRDWPYAGSVTRAPARGSGIGMRILGRRKELSWSQARLAELAHVSQQHVSMIESGKIQPNYRTLLRLAESLGLALEIRAMPAAGEALRARKKMWERFREFERNVQEADPPAVRLRQIGELVELFDALHGTQIPEPGSVAAQGSTIQQWRSLLARARVS